MARLTSDQRASVQSAILIGHTLEDFASRHPEYPQDALAQFWEALAAEIKAKKLEPGQYWGIPSEWQAGN